MVRAKQTPTTTTTPLVLPSHPRTHRPGLHGQVEVQRTGTVFRVGWGVGWLGGGGEWNAKVKCEGGVVFEVVVVVVVVVVVSHRHHHQ